MQECSAAGRVGAGNAGMSPSFTISNSFLISPHFRLGGGYGDVSNNSGFCQS